MESGNSAITRAIFCDGCERKLELGERYTERLEAIRTVGEPPPIYAAKTHWCEECDK